MLYLRARQTGKTVWLLRAPSHVLRTPAHSARGTRKTAGAYGSCLHGGAAAMRLGARGAFAAKAANAGATTKAIA